jgi:hypothetical protein
MHVESDFADASRLKRFGQTRESWSEYQLLQLVLALTNTALSQLSPATSSCIFQNRDGPSYEYKDASIAQLQKQL